MNKHWALLSLPSLIIGILFLSPTLNSCTPAVTSPPCNVENGWPVPLSACSDSTPCPLDTGTLTAPITAPTCSTPNTTIGNLHASYNDGAPKTLTDTNGLARYYCEYRPPGTASGSKRPLLIWLHGGSGGAQNVYEFSDLRTKAITYNVSGDVARPGFILVSIQARNLRWPTTEVKHGTHHDFYYRDFASPSTNPDIDFVDKVIDKLVSEGVVNTNRIYLSGISNGGFFSEFYSMARYNTATAGGNKVASIAIYSAGDPYQSPDFDQSPSCQLDPYPTSSVPILLFSRNCDLITCTQAQLDRFRSERQPLLSPGFVVDTWVSDLSSKIQNSNVTWYRLNAYGAKVAACLTSTLCTYNLAVLNHISWPDGINDTSGSDYEPEMLDFLRTHPRS